jgi:hypothetical protein
MNVIKEKLKYLNITLAFLLLPFMPIMIPFYQIEPNYLCKNDMNNSFKICEIEEICSNNNYITLQNDTSFKTFKYSFYDLHKRVACRDIFSLKYFYLFYYLGVLFGKILVDFAKVHTILRHFLFLVSVTLNCVILLIYLFKGVNFDLLFPIFSFNSGLCFYFLSFILYDTIEDKRRSLNILLNGIYAIGALVHICLFYFTQDWQKNAFCYLTTLALCFCIYSLTCIPCAEGKDNTTLVTKKYIRISNKEKIKSFLFPNHLSLDISLSKIADRKYVYFQFLLICLTSLTTNSINGFLDNYSYNKFEDPAYMFLNGGIVYISELIAIVTVYFKYRSFNNKMLYNIYAISFIGIALTFCIVGRRIPFILTLALGLAKFGATIFNNYLIFTLSNHYVDKVRNINYITYLTILSGVASPFIMNLQNNFLVLSVLYYICFVLNIKLIE